MLIQSSRYTTLDYTHWRELERADLANAQSERMTRLVEQSMREIDTFLRGGDCVCSVSWGKDSVVVADLVHRIDESVPLAWVKVDDVFNPDCLLVRDAFFGIHGLAVYREFRVSHAGKGTGRLAQGFQEMLEFYGPRRISGVRADESGGRKISLRTHGLTANDSCRPLGWWKTDDIFAYLAMRCLPVHPAYACLGNGRWDRQHLRVATLGGERGDQFGRTDWEKEYYGTEMRHIQAAQNARR